MTNNQDGIQLLWADALAEYGRETERSLSLGGLAAFDDISSIDQVAKLIEDSNAKFRGFRSRRHHLWSALETFITPVSAIAQIGVTPASVADFGFATSAVLGAVVYLVKACEGVSNAYDWIEQVFWELHDFAGRLGQYVSMPIDATLRHKVVAILATILRVIGRSEHLIRERRFREYLRVTFLGKDKYTKKLLDDLSKLLDSEQKYILGITYTSTKRAEVVLEEAKGTLKHTLDAVRGLEGKVLRNEDNAHLKQALGATSAWDEVEETYTRNKRSLLKDTGIWLQNEPPFQSWMNRDVPILWIFGGPGAGKSFLTTSIIKRLIDRSTFMVNRGNRTESLAYFFIKEDNEVLRDANNILKTLAWQIASHDDSFREHVINMDKHRKLTAAAEHTWENLFLAYYNSAEAHVSQAVTILIDGLDEAGEETRKTILGLVKDAVIAQKPKNYQVMRFGIIGRGSLRSDVTFKWSKKPCVIEVSRIKNQNDINTYIRKRLEELDVLREMRKARPDGLRKANREGSKILKKISDGADGVFLWAKLLLDSLVRKDLPHIEATLANPPSNLDDMIASIFERISKDDAIDQGVMQKMLMFMTYSRRPLQFGELELITSLPGLKPQYLLWRNMRGRLSSIFNLKFPYDHDPDVQIGLSNCTHESANDSSDYGFITDENEGLFDFDNAYSQEDGGGDVGDTDSSGDTGSDDGDFLNAPGCTKLSPVQGLEFDDDKNPRTEAKDESDIIQSLLSHLSHGQLKTEVSFYHSRIRDYLVREGSPETRERPQLGIIPSVQDPHTNITIICLDILRLGPTIPDEYISLSGYPLCHLAHHLEHIDRDSIADSDAAKIIEGLYWVFGTEKGSLGLLRPLEYYDEFSQCYSNNDRPFWKMWVETDKYLKIVQAWLSQAEVLRGFMSTVDDEAMAWIEKAIEVFPDRSDKRFRRLWDAMATWASFGGDYDKAYAASWESFKFGDPSPHSTATLLRMLNKNRNYAKGIEILQGLDEAKASRRYGLSSLVDMLAFGVDRYTQNNLFGEMGNACAHHGRPQFILNALDKALAAINAGNTPLDDTYVMIPYNIAKVKSDSAGIANNQLSQCYFDMAIASRKQASEAQPTSAHKLKQLAARALTSFHEDDEGFFAFVMPHYPLMLWGRWLRDYKEADDITWRKCFRPSVLHMLRRNASALLSILFQPCEWVLKPEMPDVENQDLGGYENEEAREAVDNSEDEESHDVDWRLDLRASIVSSPAPSASPSSQATSPFPTKPDELHLDFDQYKTWFECDNCNKSTTEVFELYLCKVCFDIGWCGDCLALLKDPEQRNSMFFYACHPEHDFYRAWPIPDETRYIAASSYDEKGVTIRREWLEQLKGEWAEAVED
ncbi:hypothetical protein B0T21DRAFT_406742 [Apiosordaria backusii]|uniref:Fungal STAND N-terminal Goodbye domain-containing protein n=1 Tax=Apiosordaria backusii TaxID=314023 RepID=A0AA40EZ45_9PEZI|nr:hypothetical protein B0T21DRAFT_406742 [Apiosordaria backusii]